MTKAIKTNYYFRYILCNPDGTLAVGTVYAHNNNMITVLFYKGPLIFERHRLPGYIAQSYWEGFARRVYLSCRKH